MIIEKAPRDMRISAIKKLIPWGEVEKLDSVAESAWMGIYQHIEKSGGVAYWDGDIIPTSDTQHDSVESFLMEVPACADVTIM